MIEDIKKLGLNEYEAKAYHALLSRGTASAVDVARVSGIPRARVYDVLVSLESKGFVVKGASKPIKFSVVRPGAAFELIADKERKNLDARLENYRVIADSLEKMGNSGPQLAGESAWVIEGRPNIYSKVLEQLDSCNESVVLSSSETGLARKKGFFGKKISELNERGVKVVSKPKADSRFIVFDKDSVMLFLTPELKEENEKALLIKSPFVANYFYSASKK